MLRNSQKVRVTKEFIDAAERRNTGNCAVRIAVGEAVPGASHVSVNAELIKFSVRDEDVIYYVATPPKVAEWLRRFDAEEDVRPFTFTLNLNNATVRPRKHMTAVQKAAHRTKAREHYRKGSANTGTKVAR